ncbi:hydroxyisourate hydrolase [Arthrobacter sp. BL-252-APC-1A]|uniref:hydroxyisourate hydrolase n=1 Tax=Arthrobacter sp. BL-252-APC-1A TaxID=2606622 RepID=UPI0012B3BE40|nr:hydroxyisourate hydrolase [Arthrobacter sp. BL-252-APC-1A]MSR99879.1 hydroxyisourate hydrolase [Arthrobacter sp. BL-252-APC-1A]
MTSRITTHVLDTSTGQPASGIPVSLQVLGHLDWQELGTGTTDADGRISDLGPRDLPSGSYRLEFATETYFTAAGTPSFFPSVTVTFTVAEQEHYHVPLLISPFAYSTYRGS